jgi:peroxiredoxin
LAGFEKNLAALRELGVGIVAASVDPIDKAKEIAADLSFPIGYGVTREIADQLGSWWEERRQIIQPSEFVLDADNNVLICSYSDGPLGRIEGEDVVKLVNFYESQKG